MKYHPSTNSLNKFNPLSRSLALEPFGLIIRTIQHRTKPYPEKKLEIKQKKRYVSKLAYMLLNTSSSRTYDLRTRTRAGGATQPSRVPVESPELDSPSNEAPPRYDGTVSHAEAPHTVRLYSDAVASRPPSPRRERPLLPALAPTVGTTRLNLPELSEVGSYKEHSEWCLPLI